MRKPKGRKMVHDLHGEADVIEWKVGMFRIRGIAREEFRSDFLALRSIPYLA